MIRVAVLGAKGRMGRHVCAAVEGAPDMRLVAALDRGVTIDETSLAGADVAVDFTTPTDTLANTLACIEASVAPVVGTSGWDEAGLEQVAQACARTGMAALVAPNFALSAVLVMHFAGLAAGYFESVEVVEGHHPGKLDAPSGTAAATCRAIAAARASADLGSGPDATQSDPVGARGGRIDGVPVHSLRLAGLTAHQQVVFGNAGETLTLSTDCYQRDSFMPGVLLAIRRVRTLDGLAVGLERVMGLG